MKITGEKSISNYIQMMLQFILVIAIVGMVFLVPILKYYIQFLGLNMEEFLTPVSVILYLSGITSTHDRLINSFKYSVP